MVQCIFENDLTKVELIAHLIEFDKL